MLNFSSWLNNGNIAFVIIPYHEQDLKSLLWDLQEEAVTYEPSGLNTRVTHREYIVPTTNLIIRAKYLFWI